MAKVSMKMTSEEIQKNKKAQKNKVKKYDGGNLLKIEDAFYRCTEEEKNAINQALEDFVSGYDFQSFLEELFEKSANILDGFDVDGYDLEKAIKTLKSHGYKVIKEEKEVEETEEIEEGTEPESLAEPEDTEETEEVEEVEDVDEDGDADVEVDVDVEKSLTLKSAYALLRKRGWVGKKSDDGIDAEELEGEVLDDPVAKVPETPEPVENVQQTETKLPDADAILPETENSKDVGEKEGNDADAILPETENNKPITSAGQDLKEDPDDIETAIKMKRERAIKSTGMDISYQTVQGTVPISAMYRQTEVGAGKLPVSQFLGPAVNKLGNDGKKGVVGMRRM